MKAKTIILMLVVTTILVLSSLFVYADSPAPPSDNFKLDFSEFDLSEGDWQISIVSIPKYEVEDISDAFDYFEELKGAYLERKSVCGILDYDEVSEDDPCYIGYGYGGYTNTASACAEKPYRCFLNFMVYHYNHKYLFGYPRTYITSFYPYFGEINDNIAVVKWVKRGTEGPYFVVLEKMNSKDEVYFSAPVNITWNTSETINWGSENVHPLKIYKLELSNPNTLIIDFENSELGPDLNTSEQNQTTESTLNNTENNTLEPQDNNTVEINQTSNASENKTDDNKNKPTPEPQTKRTFFQAISCFFKSWFGKGC